MIVSTTGFPAQKIHIEQSFGMLIGRWGLFWRSLKCTLAKDTIIVVDCCKLHNFIIDNTESLYVLHPSYANIKQQLKVAYRHVYLLEDCDLNDVPQHRRRDLKLSQISAEFQQKLQQALNKDHI